MFQAVIQGAARFGFGAMVALWGGQGLAQNPVAAAQSPKLVFTAQEMALAQAVSGDADLAAFYGSNGLTPIFTGPEGVARRQAVMTAISSASAHGLPPARYGLDDLRTIEGQDDIGAEVAFARAAAIWARDVGDGLVDPRRVDSAIKREVIPADVRGMLQGLQTEANPDAVMDRLPPDSPAYRMLQAQLGHRPELVAPADVALAVPGLWKPGMDAPEIGVLRARLASIGFASDAAQGDHYDETLKTAVAGFQKAAGLPVDGVAGKMTVGRLNGDPVAADRAVLMSMERLRWLNGHDLNARHIWANLPDYRVRIYQDGMQVFETKGIIGKADADAQTPEFSDNMKYVVANPRWNVPRSMTIKTYLPRLQANRNAVAHLDVVDSRGRVIPRSQIDFNKYTASNFPYRLQQQPSDDNALGLVKFLFPNQYNIYLHDTPTKHLFGNATRAYSAGCVRIGDPFDLATQLLSQQTDDPRGMFMRAINSGKETWLTVKPTVPIHLVYFTLWPDVQTGKMQRYADIYGRDARLWAAMQKAGLE